MVLNFYKLAEQPFGVTPDPRYLYFSATHREALASALYGVTAGRGFTALIAKPGMGKTTLLFDFLSKVRNHAKTVFLFQPQGDPRDLLRSLLADLSIEDDGADFVRMHRKLNECLLSESRRGKRLVVVLDEAQNLSEPVLEAVRMLSNFETPREKLMHLVLAGQPQLADTLASPRLVQLRQRISIVARLRPFNARETEQYIEHRLRVAGYDFSTPMFSERAMAMIAKYTRGIPRNINNVCFNAMSLGFVARQRTIDETAIQEVIGDLDLSELGPDVPDALEAARENEFEEPRVQAAAATVSSNVTYQAPAQISNQLPTPASPQTQTPTRGIRRPTSPLHRLAPQLMLAAMLVVALSWLGIQAKRHAGADVLASPPATSMKKPLKTQASPAGGSMQQTAKEASAAATTVTSDESVLVTVLPNDTLFQISSRILGTYDDETLAKILQLNPWLSDPNHIEPGQQIRVPGSVGASTNAITERVPAALSTGAER